MKRIKCFFSILVSCFNKIHTSCIIKRWRFLCFIKYFDNSVLNVGHAIMVVGGVDFLPRRKGKFIIGNGVKIHKGSKIVVDGGNLVLGDGSCFGEGTIFNCFDDITIEDHVLTADRVSFICNKHQYMDVELPIINQPTTHGPIFIGSGTWLGLNAVVLADTHIGRNCVIAANAVVKGNFPDYCVIAGMPGKIVKYYNIYNKRWEKVQ